MKMIINKSVVFNASKASVWDLLTNPDMTKQYMFGCEVISDWTVGSPILWNGQTENGKTTTLVKGQITAIEDGEKVTFTMLDPNIGIEDIPENYARLTYALISSSATETTLRLTQDFEGTADAEKRYQESAMGWDMVIDLMKKLIA